MGCPFLYKNKSAWKNPSLKKGKRKEGKGPPTGNVKKKHKGGVKGKPLGGHG